MTDPKVETARALANVALDLHKSVDWESSEQLDEQRIAAGTLLDLVPHLADALLATLEQVAALQSAPLMQPIELDSHGVARFRRNKLVEHLLNHGGLDMNALALVRGIPREDRAQFAQLIGYSVSGYGDLSYALHADEADRRVDELVKKATS